jgi:hypothetical protein
VPSCGLNNCPKLGSTLRSIEEREEELLDGGFCGLTGSGLVDNWSRKSLRASNPWRDRVRDRCSLSTSRGAVGSWLTSRAGGGVGVAAADCKGELATSSELVIDWLAFGGAAADGGAAAEERQTEERQTEERQTGEQ